MSDYFGTISKTSALMAKYNITAKKKFGQNFLVEPTIINKVLACLNEDCTVIEIGTGLGALTQAIGLKVKKVIGYEIDEELYQILKIELKDYPNIELHNQDFLTVDLPALLNSLEGEIVVVSNLPYYITTELLMNILTNSKRISKVVAMMQKEVADRFLNNDKGKDYNALQVIAPYYADISLLTKVNRHNYLPAPKVDSAILEFKIRDYHYQVKDETKLLAVIKACFTLRRKVITTNLKNAGFHIEKQQLDAINVSENARVEQLTLDDFIKISEEVD